MNQKIIDLGDDHLFLVFPYDRDDVEAIKKIKGAKWDKLGKVWRVPVTSIVEARNFAMARGFKMSAAVARFDAPKKLHEPDGITFGKEWIYINFYHDEVRVRHIKKIPGVVWDPKTKAWRAPKSSVREVVGWADSHKMEVPEELREEVGKISDKSKAMMEASRAEEADIVIKSINGELMPYQKAGVAYATNARRCFIADDMGLGKTLQAIASLEYYEQMGEDSYPAVVACPPNLVLNWKAEFAKWAPHRNVSVVTDRKSFPDEEKHDVLVIGYSNIHHWHKLITGYKSFVCDESHYLKTKEAQRTKAATKIAKGIGDGLVLCLTGTPVTNRPMEYASQLSIIGRINELGGEWGFYRRYCAAFKDKFGHWILTGSSNLEELNDKLRSSCYIRRTKDQVLTELPDVVHDIYHIGMSEKQAKEYAKAENDIVEYIVKRAEEIAKELGKSPRSAAVVAKIKAESNLHLVRISVLRKLAAKAKMESIKEWIAANVEAGEKVVVAAHHREIVDELASEFGGLKIQGGMKVEEVEEAKKKFQTLPVSEAPVIVLSIQAAKTGHTLTAAQKVLFVELPWTPADVDQLYSRCHRIGQKGSVMVTYSIADGTIDENIYSLIDSKREVVKAAVDGSGSEDEEESVAQLVADFLKRGLND